MAQGDRGGVGSMGPQRDMTYYMSDPHWGHERIIELCDRPFRRGGEPDVRAMNEAIVEGINRRVRPRDHLVILGDIVMGKFEDNVRVLREIRARRITLLPGNHDRWSLAYQHRGSGAEVKMAKRKLWKSQYEAVRTGIVCMPDRAPSVWSATLQGRIGVRPRNRGGQDVSLQVLMSHYPYQEQGDSHGEDRYRWLRGTDGGIPLVHGHVHGRWLESLTEAGTCMFNVGVDVNEFAPVSGDELIERLLAAPMGGGRANAVVGK